MIWAVLGAGVCGFVIGAVIGGVISYEDGYNKGVQTVYDYYRMRRGK